VLRGSQGGAGGSKGRALADDEPTTPELKAVTA
jgi:hypothetical protein